MLVFWLLNGKVLKPIQDNTHTENIAVLACRQASLKEGQSRQSVAIVLGSAVNQDGRSSSLTAPNGPSQQVMQSRFQLDRAALLAITSLLLPFEMSSSVMSFTRACKHDVCKDCIRGAGSAAANVCCRLHVMHTCAVQVLVNAALEHAGVWQADVRFVAVHGTGTPLGDPIEVGALGAALGTGRAAASQLVLGSNKVTSQTVPTRLLSWSNSHSMQGLIAAA